MLVAQLYPTLCNPVDSMLPGPLSMEFSRQEYWSGLPFPSPGDLPDPRIEPSFCYTMKWVSHMYTGIPSLLNLPHTPTPISCPSGSSQSTEPSSLCHPADPHYCFTHGRVYMSILISQFVLSFPLPLCARVHSLCLHLCSCPGNWLLCTIFLDSTCMHWSLKQFRVLFFLTVWI